MRRLVTYLHTSALFNRKQRDSEITCLKWMYLHTRRNIFIVYTSFKMLLEDVVDHSICKIIVLLYISSIRKCQKLHNIHCLWTLERNNYKGSWCVSVNIIDVNRNELPDIHTLVTYAWMHLIG